MMKTALYAGLLATAAAQSVPQISSDNTDITLTASGGDINIATSQFSCSGQSTCGLGETLQSMTDMAAAQSSTIAAQASMITAMNASLSNYATMDQLELYNDANREYALGLFEDLANRTLNATDYADLVNSHLNIGTLHGNGTLLVDMRITSDGDIAQELPLINHVRAIHGNLQIYSLNSMPTLGANLFTQLEYVSGDITIQSCNGLRNLSGLFPALTSVGGSVTVRYLNNLETYGNAFANLTTIGGSLILSNNNPQTTGVTVGDMLPRLNSLSGASLGSNFNAQTMIYVGSAYYYPGSSQATASTYAELVQQMAQTRILTGDMYLRSLPAQNLTQLAPQLTTIGGQFYMYDCDSITTLANAFPNVVSVGSNVYIYGSDGITTMQNFMSQVTSVGGGVYINYCRGLVTAAGAFARLATLGNRVYIYNCDAMTTMPQFTALTDMPRGDIYIYSNNALSTFDNTYFPNLRSCRGLTIRYCSSQLTSLNGIFPSLVNNTGILYIGNNDYVTTMNGAFPVLQRVNSYIYFYFMRRLTSLGTNGFPQLTTTGGIQFYYCFQYSPGGNLNNAFPALTTIGSSGVYFYRNTYLRSIDGICPQVTSIGGRVYFYWNQNLNTATGAFPRVTSITSYFYIYRNAFTSITNFMPALTSVSSYFNINYETRLTTISGSFTSLRTVGSYFYLISCGSLSNIGNSFTALTTVSGNWYVYSNSRLGSVGSAFQNLRTVSGQVRFYYNGRSVSNGERSFCQSVDQNVCPASSSRYGFGTYGASSCCNTFCASSTAC